MTDPIFDEPAQAEADQTLPFLYQQLVGEIEANIINGTYQVGDRLPSIRALHRQSALSLSTVFKAYTELETMGLIEARPKSGYYVSSAVLKGLEPPSFKKQPPVPRKVSLTSMVSSILMAMNDPNMIPFGSSSISTELLPFKAITRIIKGFNTAEIKEQLDYGLTEGEPELRRRISRRMVGWIKGLRAEDIIITNGCSEALTLALKAVVEPGETIAVESPTHFGLLQLLNGLGVMIVEVATDPQTGLKVDELEETLARHKVKACVAIPNFHNPMGSLMPDEKKKQLVELLSRHGIPLIEDAIYAELYYGPKRPSLLKEFDEKDLVITCGSFSKTIVPGLRIGWILPGRRFFNKAKDFKAGINITTSRFSQNILANYLSGGVYERHLRSLRRKLKHQTFNTARAILKYFPPGTRLALPQGGALLWVQLPEKSNGTELYHKALDHNISILPGRACAMGNQFENFIRIGCGHPFTEKMEKGIYELGEIVKTMLTD